MLSQGWRLAGLCSGDLGLGIPGPPEAGCSSQSPCNGPMVAWQSWGALCDGEQLWLVRVGIPVEAGQTLAQVEVSSVWFRGCA